MPSILFSSADIVNDRLQPLLITRFLLNLRQASEAGAGMYSTSASMGEVVFASSAPANLRLPPSLLDNMGESLDHGPADDSQLYTDGVDEGVYDPTEERSA